MTMCDRPLNIKHKYIHWYWNFPLKIKSISRFNSGNPYTDYQLLFVTKRVYLHGTKKKLTIKDSQ